MHWCFGVIDNAFTVTPHTQLTQKLKKEGHYVPSLGVCLTNMNVNLGNTLKTWYYYYFN